MVTYEQWNQTIISYFFEDCDPDQIVFLQTNAETLSEVAEQFDLDAFDATESLKVAIRNKVIQGRSVNLWEIYPTDLWEDRPQEDPPQVAFLALTVLSASMMVTSEEAFHTNYYVRLNQLLFNEPYRGKPQGIDYWEIEAFWKHLQRWARHQSDVELYLREGPKNRRYVWYPISQCLISKHDLPKIYRFFESNNLHPFSNLSDVLLLSKLRYWASPCELSAKIRCHLYEEHYAQLIASQVQSLLKNWDGEIPPDLPRDKGYRHAKIDVQLRFDRFDNAEIRYWFRQRYVETAINLHPNILGINRLQPLDGKWFQPVPDDQHSFWKLRHRLQLQTAENNPFLFTLEPSNIWVFRCDPDRDDGWLNQKSLVLGAPHLIVFHKRLAEKAISFLLTVCSTPIEEPQPIYVAGSETHWLHLQAEPIKSLTPDDPEIWRLHVASTNRICPIGGLSVKDRFGKKAYLDICLPTILVPDLGLSDDAPLYIDEQAFPVPPDRKVKLDRCNPGVYHISYGSKQLELRVTSPDRSLEHEKQPLVIGIDARANELPIFRQQEISATARQSGLWLTGAKFLGSLVPQTTWVEMETEPAAPSQSVKSPAHLISSVVQAAIELKRDPTFAPEWLSVAIDRLDHHVALRSLVEKRLRRCGESALSYLDLRELEGR